MVNDIMVPRGTPSFAIVSGAGAWVGPMMKLPSAPAGGSVPSGSSVARGQFGFDGSRVGGLVLKSRPVVSMKKGAAFSLVLAPGGTAMFWVTQVVWARAVGRSHTADINVPTRTANMLFIFFPRISSRFSSPGFLRGKYVELSARVKFPCSRWRIIAAWPPSLLARADEVIE